MAAAMRIESEIDSASANIFTGAGVEYLIQTPEGALYCVYIDNFTDVLFKKSSDGGRTWSRSTRNHLTPSVRKRRYLPVLQHWRGVSYQSPDPEGGMSTVGPVLMLGQRVDSFGC